MRLLLIVLLAFGAIADASTRRTDTCWNGRYYEHGHCPAPYEVITEGVFVDPSSGGSNLGTFDDPFTSFPTSGISTSEDVYVMEDTVFEDQRLQPSWIGSLADRSIIGTYCAKDGQPVAWSPTACSGARAEWNGDFDATCRADNSCDVDNGSAIPTSRFSGLVQPTGSCAYLTFQSIRVIDSAGAGMYFSGCQYINVIDSLVLYSANSAVRLNGGTHHSLVAQNELGWSGLCHANPEYTSCTNWPPALMLLTGGGYQNAALNNWVHDAYGEGIGMYQLEGTEPEAFGLVRGNRVQDVRSVGIYVSGTSNNVIERNVVFISTNIDTTEIPDWSAAGWEAIGINAENGDPQEADGNVVRINVMTDKEDCYRIGIGSSNPGLGLHVGTDVFHNTCVLLAAGTETGVEIGATLSPSAVGTYNKIGGNITYAPDLGSGALCQFPDGQWNFRPNSWSGTPSDSDCLASGSAYNTKPTLGTDADSWGFSRTSGGPQPSDFAITGGATGEALQATLLDADDYYWFSALGHYGDGCVPDQATWEKESAYDYNCDLFDASTPTMGAVQE